MSAPVSHRASILGRVWAPLALTLLAGGCAFPGATAHNLDELHASDGRHKRTGNLLSPFGYILAVGLKGMLQSVGSKVQEPTGSTIEDPTEACVDALEELAGFDAHDPRTAATQVEYFARLAVFDAWNLSREIAVRELGRAGVRLDLAQQAESPETGEPASAEQVHAALTALVEAAAPLVKGSGSEAERAQFAARCSELGALRLDLEGATRVLRLVGIVDRATSLADARFAPLRELSLDLQRRCVRSALEHALGDAPPGERGGSAPGWNHPRVRAAALEACVRVWGEPKLAQFLSEVKPGEGANERLIALLRLVARRGLPEPAGSLPAEERARLQQRWTQMIVEIAGEHPDGSVRIAAMSALGKLSGLGRFTLREEEWQRWWAARATSATPPPSAAGEQQP